jgi:hypothetical protein
MALAEWPGRVELLRAITYDRSSLEFHSSAAGRAVGPRLMSGYGPGSRATCSAVLFGVLEAYPPVGTTPGVPGEELVTGSLQSDLKKARRPKPGGAPVGAPGELRSARRSALQRPAALDGGRRARRQKPGAKKKEKRGRAKKQNRPAIYICNLCLIIYM